MIPWLFSLVVLIVVRSCLVIPFPPCVSDGAGNVRLDALLGLAFAAAVTAVLFAVQSIVTGGDRGSR